MEVEMQGGWRWVSGDYWVQVENSVEPFVGYGTLGVHILRHASPRLEPPCPTKEGATLIGILALPTLAGGMQRWNR
ncbi:MAG: hypothetical protein NZL85_00575 [Fimbriimonadales bacterium]|nr:hypothetical protein [Fimbriimonadales bacterium]